MHAQPSLNGVIGNTQLPFTNYKWGGGGVVYMGVWFSTVPTYIYTYIRTYVHTSRLPFCESAFRKEPVLHVLIMKYEIMPNPNPNTKMAVNTMAVQY